MEKICSITVNDSFNVTVGNQPLFQYKPKKKEKKKSGIIKYLVIIVFQLLDCIT